MKIMKNLKAYLILISINVLIYGSTFGIIFLTTSCETEPYYPEYKLVIIEEVPDSLAVEYKGQAIIGKVDVSENPELTSKFGIRSIPTLIYLKDDEVIDKYVGSTSKIVLPQIKLASLISTLLSFIYR
jgi:thiol-disulfide isomerase/thioredoxin